MDEDEEMNKEENDEKHEQVENDEEMEEQHENNVHELLFAKDGKVVNKEEMGD